jgi:CO/xanthine dehydrogenase Mo-binding subunit
VRGFLGVVNIALEGIMDTLAEKTGLDPFEFRVRRLGKKIRAGADFIQTPAGKLWQKHT